MLSHEQLQRAAASAGYPVESYEKVHKLVQVLDGLRAHPFLGSRLALKGGTAINLFVLDLPRLSVDIDLNYVGAADRSLMLAERPRVEQGLEQVFGRAGLNVRRTPTEHAGGKWRLSYTTALGRPGSIEVDVNFMFRTPIWPTGTRDSHLIGGQVATGILVLDDHELAAGKLAALVARSASRDLFDARELLRRGTLDARRLRLAFVVYGGINREDWRTVTLDDVVTTVEDVDHQLVPMLRQDVRPSRAALGPWTTALVGETRDLMTAVLPLTATEVEFINRLNGFGEVVAELLTDEPAERSVIQNHPGLLWKAQNVRQHVTGT
jgi:predicted nucleotidyltransferase component of viral defense system